MSKVHDRLRQSAPIPTDRVTDSFDPRDSAHSPSVDGALVTFEGGQTGAVSKFPDARAARSHFISKRINYPVTAAAPSLEVTRPSRQVLGVWVQS